jgi:hypothetical protein
MKMQQPIEAITPSHPRRKDGKDGYGSFSRSLAHNGSFNVAKGEPRTACRVDGLSEGHMPQLSTLEAHFSPSPSLTSIPHKPSNIMEMHIII